MHTFGVSPDGHVKLPRFNGACRYKHVMPNAILLSIYKVEGEIFGAESGNLAEWVRTT
jgi:hypothetical protein